MRLTGSGRQADYSHPAAYDGSPERFGYEWQKYSEPRPEYETQFRRWAAHLKP
jgi:hypothetical protein